MGKTAIAVALLAFGPCSKSEPAPEKAKDEAEKEPKKSKKEKSDDEGFKPAPLEKEWVGMTNGTTPEGGSWQIQVYNCSKDFAGPWHGYFTFKISSQGMNMNGNSVEWPEVSFDLAKPEVKPLTVKSKVDATGPANFKMNMNIATELEVSIEPPKYFLIREKKAAGTGKATASAGGTQVSIPLFGAGDANKMHKIELKAYQCIEEGIPMAPLVPTGKKK